MTIRTVRAGRTAFANGALALGDQLNIQGGTAGGGAGGTAFVTTSLTNAGAISVRGGAASTLTTQPGGQGGLLDVVGILTDSGSIVVRSGHAAYQDGQAGQGARLVVTGTLSVTQTGSVTVRGGTPDASQNEGVLINAGLLDNSGQLDLAGGAGGTRFGPNGYGSILDSTGTLTSSGTITLHGGTRGFEADSGQGANLVDSGVLTNTGMIMIDGGTYGGYLSGGAGGGTLAVSGLLTNTGSVVLGSGGAGYGSYGSGYGGTLLDSGTIANSGTIDVRGGGASNNEATNGTAAQLIDTGVLTNAAGATLRIEGSHASAYVGSNGGTVMVNGYLGGYGNISITGGAGSEAGLDAFAGAGGVLVDNGRLVLGGALLIGGGKASAQAQYFGGTGGTLSVTGDGELNVTGAGGITVEGGAASTVTGKSTSGQGGVLDVAGTMFSTTIELQGGGAPQPGFMGGGGASLIVSGYLNVGGGLIVDATQGGQSATVTVMATGVLRTSPSASTIQNNGRIVLEAGSYIYGTPLEGVLNNSGMISGSGSISTISIVNGGIIDAGSGQLALLSDIVTSGAKPGAFTVGTGGILTLDGGSIDASQSVMLAGAAATLAVTAGNAGVLVKSIMGGVLDITGGGSAILNAADTNLSVFLSSATNLTLSRMGAIAGTGSSGADSITALAAGQTLTGGLGADLLTGAAATGDLFRDMAAGLNGDTIAAFAGTDAIDITDIAPGAGLALAYTQQGDHGLLEVSNGSVTTVITLQGSFTQSSFATASDNHGGVQITLHG